MIHTKGVNIRAERETLVVNLERHRQAKKKMLEAIEDVRRLIKEASALQEEARHLVAPSREI